MKKYLIILIFNFVLLNNFSEYKVSLYNIPMAYVTINYENIIFDEKEAISLDFKTETNKFASNIFKVDNYYKTIIEKNTLNILSFEKNTSQPGLTNQINTISNNNEILYANTNIKILENYFNIFSLLYYLTITPFMQINPKIKLEREGILYDCVIKKREFDNQYEYELIFNLISKDQIPIIKNTDMFTWAIFKENSYKKIIVNKNQKIKSCKFTFGLTSLRANLKD